MIDVDRVGTRNVPTLQTVGKCVVVFPCDDDDDTETCSFDDMLILCDRVEKKLERIASKENYKQLPEVTARKRVKKVA